MKTKNGFRLRNICGENVIMAEGIENIDFSKIITLNESAAYLWQKIEGKEFTEDQLVQLLTAEYEVDGNTATCDVHTILGQWQEVGIIE